MVAKKKAGRGLRQGGGAEAVLAWTMQDHARRLQPPGCPASAARKLVPPEGQSYSRRAWTLRGSRTGSQGGSAGPQRLSSDHPERAGCSSLSSQASTSSLPSPVDVHSARSAGSWTSVSLEGEDDGGPAIMRPIYQHSQRSTVKAPAVACHDGSGKAQREQRAGLHRLLAALLCSGSLPRERATAEPEPFRRAAPHEAPHKAPAAADSPRSSIIKAHNPVPCVVSVSAAQPSSHSPAAALPRAPAPARHSPASDAADACALLSFSSASWEPPAPGRALLVTCHALPVTPRAAAQSRRIASRLWQTVPNLAEFYDSGVSSDEEDDFF